MIDDILDEDRNNTDQQSTVNNNRKVICTLRVQFVLLYDNVRE